MASEEEILNAALMKRFLLTHHADGVCVTPAYINALIDLPYMRDAFKSIHHLAKRIEYHYTMRTNNTFIPLR